MKEKFEVEVTRKKDKGSCFVVVRYMNSNPPSEFRVYSGRKTLARVIAGVINKFLNANKGCNVEKQTKSKRID